MNTRLLLAGSLRALTRYKLRAFFMSLGIVVGVGALVVMRSLGSGAQQDMIEKIEKVFSAGSIMIVNSSGAMRGGLQNPGKLTVADVEVIGEQLEQVIDWNPSVAVSGREVQYLDRNRSLLIIGDSERAQFVNDRGVTDGDFFSASDVRSAARVALIGRAAAEALFGDEDPIGKQVQIDGAPFRVKGVLEPAGADPHGMDRDDEVHIPVTTLMRRLLDLETIGTAKLIVSSPEAVDSTADQVIEILRSRHSLANDAPDDFTIYTPTEVQQRVREANRVLTVYLPATAGIALLVAAIVIANIMLIGVRERTPEIGLRKALGATNRQISTQFLLESLAVTFVSGLLGVSLGFGILTALGWAMGTAASITADSVAMGLVAALVVGVGAGFLPARQAALQEPVDALR